MDDIRIVNAQKEDIENIFCLFRRPMELQGKNGYKVIKDYWSIPFSNLLLLYFIPQITNGQSAYGRPRCCPYQVE